MPHFSTLDPRLVLTAEQFAATEQGKLIDQYRSEKVAGDDWSLATAWINHDDSTVAEFQQPNAGDVDAARAPRPIHIVVRKTADGWSLDHYVA